MEFKEIADVFASKKPALGSGADATTYPYDTMVTSFPESGYMFVYVNQTGIINTDYTPESGTTVTIRIGGQEKPVGSGSNAYAVNEGDALLAQATVNTSFYFQWKFTAAD